MKMPSDEEFWQEKEFFCKYCGLKLQVDSSYCSELCMEKDSVWNWTDN